MRAVYRAASGGRLLAFLVVAVAAALASTASPAAAADRTIALERHESTVSVHAGTVVWNRQLAPGRWRLVSWDGTRERILPVAPRKRPFDVDLGPGPGGRLNAVYSRCRREPRSGDFSMREGRDCAVYRFDFESRREHRLQAPRSRPSRLLPAIWGDTVAYAVPRKSRVRAAVIEVSRLDGSRVRRVGAGAPTEVPEAPETIGTPKRVDLRGRRVAFDWQAGVEFCPKGDPEDDDGTGDSAYEIWSGTAGRVARVERGCTNEDPNLVSDPVLLPTGLAYLRIGTSRAPGVTFDMVRTVAGGSVTDVDPPGVSAYGLGSDGHLMAFSSWMGEGVGPRHAIVARTPDPPAAAPAAPG